MAVISKTKRLVQTMAKMQRQARDAEVVNREDNLTNNAEEKYEAEQEAKITRQSGGLGVLISVTPMNTDEAEDEKRKKSQGLGAVITGSNATLG